MVFNKYYLSLLIFISVVFLWFLGKASNEIVHYLSLNKTAEVKIIDWEINPVKEKDFYLSAFFSFSFQGKEIFARSNWGDKYPNRFAAENKLKKLSQKERKISAWFNPHRPDKVVLNKTFPYKSLIYACLLMGLNLYFFFLGKKVFGKG